jgi:hypothetical protein
VAAKTEETAGNGDAFVIALAGDTQQRAEVKFTARIGAIAGPRDRVPE